MPIRLIVGLGNPGTEYAQTRHNAGAWCVESLAFQRRVELKREAKFHGLYTMMDFRQHRCHVLIPTTYMNHSGKAVVAAALFYKIAPSEILVVHDDLDFSAGQVRLKIGGGHGGHNGLRDLIEQMAHSDFIRLRIGIGHPGNKNQVLSFVLGSPSQEDRMRIETAINESIAVMDDIVHGEFKKVQQHLRVAES